MKHQHQACAACLHTRAHGIWDGYSLALATLLKAGDVEAAASLDERQARLVNREVRKIAKLMQVEPSELSELMRHHGSSS
jgi:hypothetical protein